MQQMDFSKLQEDQCILYLVVGSLADGSVPVD